VAPWELLDSATAAKVEKGWWLVWAAIAENAENRAERLVREQKA
jgi:hypothetical protein